MGTFTIRAGRNVSTVRDALRSVDDVWVRVRDAIAVSVISEDVDNRAIAELLFFILCSGDCLIELAIFKLGGVVEVVGNGGARDKMSFGVESGENVFLKTSMERSEPKWRNLAQMETSEKA